MPELPAYPVNVRRVEEAYVTMIAMDLASSPVVVPPLLLGSEMEPAGYEQGYRRMDEPKRTGESPGGRN